MHRKSPFTGQTRWRVPIAAALIALAVATPLRAQLPDSATFHNRRTHLAKMARVGIVVIQSVEHDQPGLTEYLIDDSDNHDFLFLTGVESSNAALVLLPQSALYPEILFVPEKDIAAARARSGVHTVMSSDKFVSMLGDALTNYSIKRFTERMRKPVSSEMSRVLSLAPTKPIALNFPRYFSLSTEVPDRVQLATRIKSFVPSVEFRDASPMLDALRIRHDDADLAMIRKVVNIGGLGLVAAMKASRPGMLDTQIDSVALAEFLRQGASRLAYPSLIYIAPFARKVTALSPAEVAKSSEPVSAVHQMESGDLVMIDAGAEYQHYASDLSRTVPVSGKFTSEQRRYYDAVVAAHHAAIAAIRPGATFKQVDDAARAELHKQNLDQYFNYATSHFIGMDVHEAGDYNSPMQPGMVFTVEPGINIPEKNIGIHVEDIILVTPTGHENLSKSIPIEAADIEKLMEQK